MIGLDIWLNQATRHLSGKSAAQVRTEIQEHYESGREAAMSGGATPDDADRIALAALGDARVANCQYRRVLLTSAEARMLRQANWEARVICSRPLVKWLLAAMPAAALLTATALYLTSGTPIARVLFACGIGMALLFTAPLLPVYTPSRSRVFRCVKWVLLTGALVLAFGPDTLKSSSLLISCLWVPAWIEWTRVSIRRKLPVAEWPKQLYL
ncbi:MAG: hypothetical protein ACRD7E_14680 [Bryobacteraceae bacterium]